MQFCTHIDRVCPIWHNADYKIPSIKSDDGEEYVSENLLHMVSEKQVFVNLSASLNLVKVKRGHLWKITPELLPEK